MNITFRSQQHELPIDLKEYANRSIAFATDRLVGKIDSVAVILKDINGPKGGIDKVCSLHVKLSRGASVVVTDRAGDFRSALDLTVHRAVQAIHRLLKQRMRRRPTRI